MQRRQIHPRNLERAQHLKTSIHIKNTRNRQTDKKCGFNFILSTMARALESSGFTSVGGGTTAFSPATSFGAPTGATGGGGGGATGPTFWASSTVISEGNFAYLLTFGQKGLKYVGCSICRSKLKKSWTIGTIMLPLLRVGTLCPQLKFIII